MHTERVYNSTVFVRTIIWQKFWLVSHGRFCLVIAHFEILFYGQSETKLFSHLCKKMAVGIVAGAMGVVVVVVGVDGDDGIGCCVVVGPPDDEMKVLYIQQHL